MSLPLKFPGEVANDRGVRFAAHRIRYHVAISD
jgi:hypothetical protein